MRILLSSWGLICRLIQTPGRYPKVQEKYFLNLVFEMDIVVEMNDDQRVNDDHERILFMAIFTPTRTTMTITMNSQ
jgi:hypothetical protein